MKLLGFLLALPLAAAPPENGRWRQVFADEFEGTSVDTARWQYREDTRLWSEQRAENVSVFGGLLHIHLRKQKAGELDYTAGGLISRETFQYGYYEARLRVPKARGWHTSFWMMRYQNNGTEPRYQEIDVIENDSVRPEEYSVNWHTYRPNSSFGFKRVMTPNLSADFHVYGANFQPGKVDFYFDGKLVHSIAVGALPHAKQSIWLTAVAANFGGATSMEDARLPDEAVVDWVRYWAPETEPRRELTELNLKLLPGPQKFEDPDFYIWCGSAVLGDDRKYHMFYSRWPRKLGHYAWVTHSEIAHAVGDTPLGPWRHVGVALPPRGANYWDGLVTHNPTIIRSGTKYYLYYMGNTGDGKAMPTLNWTHRNNQRIGVAVADTPAGPWMRFDQPILDVSADPGAPDALMTSNPTVALRPDGGVLMIYKAVGKQRAMPFGGPVVHLTATADSPTGPFTKQLKPIFLAPGVDFPAEDPFAWFDYAAGRYYAIVKDNAGHFTKAGKSLALWQSTDGMQWKLAPQPLFTKTEYRDSAGQLVTVNSLERPQLVFGPAGHALALLAAVDETEARTHSYNLQIALESQ